MWESKTQPWFKKCVTLIPGIIWTYIYVIVIVFNCIVQMNKLHTSLYIEREREREREREIERERERERETPCRKIWHSTK